MKCLWMSGLFYSKLGWIAKETIINHAYPVIIMEKDLCRT
jgi:hypothetical protein